MITWKELKSYIPDNYGKSCMGKNPIYAFRDYLADLERDDLDIMEKAIVQDYLRLTLTHIGAYNIIIDALNNYIDVELDDDILTINIKTSGERIVKKLEKGDAEFIERYLEYIAKGYSK